MQKAIYRLEQNYAGICVLREGNHYMLDTSKNPPLVSVKAETMLVEIPQDKSLILDGERMKPSGSFFRTAETIDPHHIILDIWDRQILSFIGYSKR